MENHYDYWGLKVAANQAWPALVPFQAGGGSPEVRIETLAAIPAVPVTQVVIRPALASLQIAGAGRYVVRAGSLIEVAPERAARRGTLELFLFGTAWALLCYQRGLLPLHASVVEWDGGALAFCGPSGAGKSTLMAWLARRGRRLLGDDLCRFELPADGGAPVVWPSLPRLKLWRATLDALGEVPDGLEQDLATEDKFHWPAMGPTASAPAPLRAIYLLEWGPLGVERLRGSQALRQLVAAATYRPDFLEAMGGLAAQWRACAEMVRRVPIFRLSRPRDWAALDAVLALIDSQPEVAI
jgi:hypothetical protein